VHLCIYTRQCSWPSYCNFVNYLDETMDHYTRKISPLTFAGNIVPLFRFVLYSIVVCSILHIRVLYFYLLRPFPQRLTVPKRKQMRHCKTEFIYLPPSGLYPLRVQFMTVMSFSSRAHCFNRQSAGHHTIITGLFPPEKQHVACISSLNRTHSCTDFQTC